MLFEKKYLKIMSQKVSCQHVTIVRPITKCDRNLIQKTQLQIYLKYYNLFNKIMMIKYHKNFCVQVVTMVG